MAPIEVETGPMFSGKTSELITQAERLIVAEEIQGVDFLIFNHVSDTRYGQGIIHAHGKNSLSAIPISSSGEILEHIFTSDDSGEVTLIEGRDQLSTIFIDEAQFFDMDLPEVLDFIDRYYQYQLGKGINIYCAGLDMDFRGEPFGPMPRLLAIATKVNKFAAVCKKCKKGSPRNARYTQRLVDGKPASFHDPIVKVGAAENYTARCFKHHELPDHPHVKK